ncbi:MAG: LptA/OstA family protein, partial [Wenzhouxiangellaceae bacterium]
HFDVATNVVTLTGNARLRHEQGEFTGDELVYDLDTERLAGRGSAGQRARVVLEGDSMRRARGDGASPDPAAEAGADESSEPPDTDTNDSSEAPANEDQDAEPVDPPATH